MGQDCRPFLAFIGTSIPSSLYNCLFGRQWSKSAGSTRTFEMYLFISVPKLVHLIGETPLSLLLGKRFVIQQFCVGLTFQPFVGATFTYFVGPTIFVSQQMKTVGVWGNYALCCSSFVVPTDFGSEKCWRHFFPFGGPTISVPDFPVFCWPNSFLLLGSQNL